MRFTLEWEAGIANAGHDPLPPCWRKGVGADRRERLAVVPPRLPEQPIFYPVLNEDYATQIARDWNTRDGGTGYVLRFRIESTYLAQFPVRTAGARIHREYWIPAEELAEFNRHIVGVIEMVSEFAGSGG